MLARSGLCRYGGSLPSSLTSSLSFTAVLMMIVLVLGVCVHGVEGEIEQGSMKVSGMSLDRPKGFMEFGFQRNGSASLLINALPQNLPLYLLICTELDQSKFAYAADDMCNKLEAGVPVCDVTQVFTDQLRLFYVVPTYGYYYFNLVDCEQQDATVNVYAVMLNPHNNHLTATLVPVPTMYGLMAALWLMVTVLWGAHVIARWRAAVGLHALLTAYPVLKGLFSWYALEYYSYYAVHGELFAKQIAIHYGFYIISQILFNLLLLVLSRGWGMYRASLKSEKYSFFAILVGVAVLMMFRYLYDSSSQIFDLLVALGLIGFRVIILVYVFMGVNNTIRQLEAAMIRSAMIQDVNVQLALIMRHRVYVRVKIILVSWIGLTTGAFFTNLILFEGESSNWVDLMNSEFLDFILFALLACNFRLRPVADLYISGPTHSRSRDDGEQSSFDGEGGVGNVEMVSLGRTPISRDAEQTGNSEDNIEINIPPLSSAILNMSDEITTNDNDEEDEEALIQKRK